MWRTDATSIRHRRLPAEQVVWLMVALALHRHQSIGEVLDTLWVFRSIVTSDSGLAGMVLYSTEMMLGI